MSTLLTQIPDSIDAGTTVAYRRSYSDYPASSGWALTLYLAGASVANFAGVPNGAAFDVTLSAATTASLAAGVYTWVERVSKGSEKYDVGRGAVVIRPDAAAATPGSFQSWEEKTLVVVEAALSGELTSGIASYQIAGRAVSKIPPKELMEIRASLRSAINQQGNPGGLGRPIRVSFTGTGSES